MESQHNLKQSADIVMFKDHFTMPTFRRPPSQLWLLYMLECPLHTQVKHMTCLVFVIPIVRQVDIGYKAQPK